MKNVEIKRWNLTSTEITKKAFTELKMLKVSKFDEFLRFSIDKFQFIAAHSSQKHRLAFKFPLPSAQGSNETLHRDRRNAGQSQ